MIWVGLLQDQRVLQSFWELFESAVLPLGWQRDKRGFTPHITLARNPGVHPPPGWDSGAKFSERSFSIGECVLFQSILSRDGAEYVSLERMRFDGGIM